MTNSYAEIELTFEHDTATLSFSRPHAMNAITPNMLDELSHALAQLANNDGVRFVVITGAGKAFSAGVDLKALGDRELINGKVGDILDLPARKVIAQIENLPQPVIAKINGFCFTGALEIALACDLIVVAEEAKLGDTHAKWGLRPTWGMSQRLPRRIGILKAREWSLTARTIKGSDCVKLGLANAASPLADLDDGRGPP